MQQLWLRVAIATLDCCHMKELCVHGHQRTRVLCICGHRLTVSLCACGCHHAGVLSAVVICYDRRKGSS